MRAADSTGRSGRARRWRRASGNTGNDGFTLVELLMGMTVFTVILVAFGLLLGSSLKAYRVARDRTVAEQLGNTELEQTRRMTWADLGTVSGNPPGALAASSTVTVGNVAFTVTRRVELIDDPVPQGFSTGANYKRVVITVASAGMTTPLQFETVVAPPTQPSLFTGLVKARVYDTYNQYLSGVSVSISGPSPTRTDTTNADGLVGFAGLTPTDTANPYYTVTPSYTGWQLIPEDASVGQVALDPGETKEPNFHLFKPVTLTVRIVDLGNNPVTSPIDLVVKEKDTPTRQALRVYAAADGSVTLTDLDVGGKFIPNRAYLFSATSLGFTTTDAERTLTPAGYPTTVDATETIQIPMPVRTPVTVRFRDGVTLAPMVGLTGTIAGGPDGGRPFGPTDATGAASVTLLPSVSPYTVTLTATPTGYFPLTYSLPVPSTATSIDQTIDVTPLPPPVSMSFSAVNGATSSPVGNVTLTLSGGPSGPVVIPIDGSGTAANVSVVPGTYTVTGTPPVGYQAYSGTLTVTATTTSATITYAPMGAVTLNVRNASTGGGVGPATVSWNGPGGPGSLNVDGAGSGFTYLAPGTYTVSVASPPSGYAPYSGSMVVGTGSTTVNVNLQPYGVVTFTTKSATNGSALGNVAVTAVGPSGTVSFTTNGSGTSTHNLLPGTYTLTVTSPPSGYTAYSGTLTVAAGVSSVDINLAEPATSMTFRTRRNGTSTNVTNVGITLSGGPGGTYSFTTAGSGATKTMTIVPGTYTVSVTSYPSGYSTLNTTSLLAVSGSTINIYISP